MIELQFGPLHELGLSGARIVSLNCVLEGEEDSRVHLADPGRLKELLLLEFSGCGTDNPRRRTQWSAVLTRDRD